MRQSERSPIDWTVAQEDDVSALSLVTVGRVTSPEDAVFADLDGDGVPNACDDDTDGDGVPDDRDLCPDHRDPEQTDTDGDGRPDTIAAGCTTTLMLDGDDDGDGADDHVDAFPLDDTEWDDTDGDAPAGSDGTG